MHARTASRRASVNSSSARSSSPARWKSCASSNSAASRLSAGRFGRSSRFWCMRVARSISPCRRNRLPSAKCRSIVCGSTLTTSMNDSMALSGCSFSRKLSPRKYDSGSARDSRSRCLMSIRAAIQPSPKNSGGNRQQPPQLEIHRGDERRAASPGRRQRTGSALRPRLAANGVSVGAHRPRARSRVRSPAWFPARCRCAPSPRQAHRPWPAARGATG